MRKIGPKVLSRSLTHTLQLAHRYAAPTRNVVDGFRARRYTKDEKKSRIFFGETAMRKSIIVSLVVFSATQVLATGFGLKPGLWASKMTKQTVDGQDRAAQMAGAASQMQAAMASMPPEQRARMEAMMKEHGGPAMGSNGTTKMCITPEQANLDNPIVQKNCQPATISRSGNHVSFTVNCSVNGVTSTGKGEATSMGDTITTQMDMATHMANGETHTMHFESEMKFLGPDCGDVKPMSRPKASQ
jgi:hypothetical protein